MDTIILTPWTAYPAAALAVLGLVLTWNGLGRCRAAFPRPTVSLEPLLWMRGFRLTLAGLALAGIGAARLWQLEWLFWLSLAIGFEETLETSIAIYGLRRAQA